MSTLFVDTINEKTSGNGVAIPGHPVQVTALQDTTESASTSSTYAECSTAYRPAITPKSSSSKVLASFEINIWGDVDNDTQGTIAGHLNIELYFEGFLIQKFMRPTPTTLLGVVKTE